MTNELLTKLIDLKDVYYIYQKDLSIYNIPTSEFKFIIVVDNEFKVPKELKQYKKKSTRIGRFGYYFKCDNCTFNLYSLEEWFFKIENCEIECWECACLNRKYIYKEHVKLLLTTDLLKLGKNYFSKYKCIIETINGCFNAIKDLKFTLQIIENHKIVNFNEVNSAYTILQKTAPENLLVVCNSLIQNDLKILHSLVDGIIEADKRKRLKKYVNNKEC